MILPLPPAPVGMSSRTTVLDRLWVGLPVVACENGQRGSASTRGVGPSVRWKGNPLRTGARARSELAESPDSSVSLNV